MHRTAYIAMLLACVSWTAQSAESPPKKTAAAGKAQRPTVNSGVNPDIKFLEYLGTLEGDDENWTEIADSALTESKPGKDVKAEAAAKSTAGTK